MSATRPALQYECFGIIAQGSVSTVYEGFDYDLQREVVIKELRPEFRSDSDSIDSFFTEATLLAGLNHANILRVYSIDRERFWIVMEPMSGRLDTELQRGKPTFERLRAILKQLLEGVRYLHLMGRVHGQIRLDTILVDQFGQAKLSNLFIADMQDEFRRPDRQQLHTAPEILNPQHFGQPGQGSDLYGIGIVALQLAADDRFLKLFKGMDRKRQDDPMAWSAWHASAEPIGAIRAVVEDIPDDIEAAITGLTQKQVGLRFATAAEALAALTPSMPHSNPLSPTARVAEAQSCDLGTTDAVVYRGPDLFRATPSRAEPIRPAWKTMLAAQASWRKSLPSKRHLALVGTGLSIAVLLAFQGLSRGGNTAVTDEANIEQKFEADLSSNTGPKETSPAPAKSFQQPQGSQKLFIVSADAPTTPLKNIEISIDGDQPVRVSSPVYQLSKTPGSYLVRVEATNFEPKEVPVELSDGTEGQTTIALDPKKFEVSFSIQPADAMVYYRKTGDDAVQTIGFPGEEKRAKSLPAGSYIVYARADGFKTQQKSITIDQTQNFEPIDLGLERVSQVGFGIDSYPHGAQVRVDGQRIGTTPCYWRCEEGTTLTIAISKHGYQVFESKLKIGREWEGHRLLRYLETDFKQLAKRQ